ncbi:hypothetical protein [Amycolatopsis vancoresmycina]|uniref:Uncharacterized protein n=1 Tax=Amycolatopsis vancoresmycina DSM 44592 TaxID=1292037 RepID=R1IAW8_9PSEU|nr:hypothetical protein [Amycolatopsis vancoresmycina]EOD69676.1 hypothetical protein H480_04947 [Amycolatopsis vancoresmycina DSM 44592]
MNRGKSSDRDRARRPGRWPDLTATAVLLGGRPAVAVTLLAFPPRLTESVYLGKIGVPPAAVKAATTALWRQGTTWVFSVSAFALCATFVLNRVQNVLQISTSPLDPVDYFVLTFTYFGLLAAAYGVRSLSIRSRLLASSVRCARLVRAMCPDPSPDATQLAIESFTHLDLRGSRGRDPLFQLLLRNPRHRHRTTAGVAWALTRDTAHLSGRSVGTATTLGEVLLWFAQSPRDPRRRPIVAAYLAELITDVANHAPIRDADFTPAARYRTRSPRERAVRRLRSLATGALTTGILVALVAAVLRIWVK